MYYQTFDNNIYPLLVKPGDTATLKLCFCPKAYVISNLDYN